MQVIRTLGKQARVLLVAGTVCFFALQGADSPVDTDPGSAPNADWPSTKAAKLAMSFLEVLETDDDTIRAFLEQHRSEDALRKASAEERAADLRRITQQIGALVVYEVHPEGDLKVTAIARSKKLGIWLNLTFELESAPPHRLKIFDMTPATAPGQRHAYDSDAPLASLAEQAREEAGAPALAVAIIRDGRPAETSIVGVRRIDDVAAVQSGDRFHIGSVTKALTATMVARLAEAGKVRWETTIQAVLPQLSEGTPYGKVELEQLLQHLAGIRPYTDDEVDEFPELSSTGKTPVVQRRLFSQQVLNDPPVVEPGTAVRYSNAGYVVAAHIAESVASESYESLMQRLIFGPLEMRTAGFGWPVTPDRPFQPRGHIGTPPDISPRPFSEYERQDYLNPPGGLHCSIEDLGKFASLHLRGLRGENGLLRAETIRRLHTPLMTNEDGSGYASGWIIERDDRGELLHWHTGSAGTFYASLWLYPSRNLAVAVATNSAGNAGIAQKKLAEAILARSSSREEP